jgi:hypothetical protein
MIFPLKRFGKWVAILSFMTSQAALAAPSLNSKTDAEMFSKPLITGASISADWASLSPGKRLAERLVKSPDVRVIARGGQTGASVLAGVTPSVLKDRSIIIGFDLFFWDSTRASAEPSVKALKTLVAQAQERDIPLIIGDIPELIPGHQPNRKELNQMIYRSCKAAKNCFVVPLDELYQRITREGFVEIKGKKYSFFDLLPDGLHIGSVAGDYLADLVYKTIRPETNLK